MSLFLKIYKDIARGKSIARAFMHVSIEKISVIGPVVDLGGIKMNAYRPLLGINEGQVISLDIDATDPEKNIDFEKDQLPFPDEYIENFLAFNIFEHIFNYQFFVDEIFRCLKSGGKLHGFVPFLVNYHQDPHDYFRYTNEALHKIFSKAGFNKIMITPVGIGPFMVNLNNIVFSLPRPIILIIFPFYYATDSLFKLLRPKVTSRFPLGYTFSLTK